MNTKHLRRLLGVACAMSGSLCLAQAGAAQASAAQAPPVAVPSGATPRPAHAPDTDVGGHTRSDPSDGAAPPPADPLKQEAVTDPAPTLATPAVDFIMKASMQGMTEVQLGRAALGRSRSKPVQRFARALIADQERVDGSLGALALRLGTSVPTVLDAAHQGVVDGMATRQGGAFDAAYLSKIIEARDQTIPLYVAAASQTDAAVASFARQTLPALQRQRRTAAGLVATVPGHIHEASP